MKLLKYLANLGYGTRREVETLVRAGRVTDAGGRALVAGERIAHADIRVDGKALDPPPGMVVLLHKPLGYTCSRADAGKIIYQLLPSRWLARSPALSSVGRLDKDTSGLLLLTDNGALLHRITSGRSGVAKVYEATLAEPLRGDEQELFASGSLLLRSETRPLAPARLEVLQPTRVRLTLTEGRYHQVRRMFAATGNRVQTLHRLAIGGLALGDLEPGQWRLPSVSEVASVFDVLCRSPLAGDGITAPNNS